VGASAQTAPKPELYLVAIGEVPLDLINGLVSHFQMKFGVSIRTLPPLGFDQVTFDRQRSQVVADRLIQAVRFRHATLAKNPKTRVIGITPYDMYMEAMREQWAFTFSMRTADRRLAVVSYARMDPAHLGDVPDTALLRSRLRKMVTKNIGIMYFGLPASENPRSALFRNILSVDDLDRMTEDFSPK
jgi:predicted Zn-dependent protease